MKKTISILLLAGLAFHSQAQEKKDNYNSIYKSAFDDDGKTLYVKVEWSKQGQPLQKFERSYSITGMSKAAKDSLVNRLIDSLGLPNDVPPPPKPPKAPAAPKAPGQKRFAQVNVDKANTLYTKPYA